MDRNSARLNLMKKRVFSGIQPSGNLHIGNYLGAIKNWVASQDEYDNIFCVVDLHAITVSQDPKILEEKIRETAALLFACGIDPKKSVLFVQSHISAHSELAWILNCFIPIGWMHRMIQFKEKSEKQKDIVSVGLFDYPALMAADILLYETDIVPVGEDQKQHVELTRDIAERLNSLFGKTFKLPEVVIPQTGARIMGLDDPTKKMSKSEKGKNHAVYLLDSADKIREKIMTAVTDSGTEIRFDEKRAGIYNLLVVCELFTGMKRGDIEKKFAGKTYSSFKKELAEAVIGSLEPIQKRYKAIRKDADYLESLLKQNADKIRPIAEKTLSAVQDKIGLG